MWIQKLNLIYLCWMQSYVNAIVSLVENPKELLDHIVLKMNEGLIKMRQAFT